MAGILDIYTDGGARGNPGHSGIGVVFKVNGEVVANFKEYIGITTNNQAEYQAVLLAIKHLKNFPHEAVNFYLDSQLVVCQVNGTYKVKNAELRPLYQQIKDMLFFENVKFAYIPREKNQEADRLVNQAIDGYLNNKTTSQ
ncbi:TPA: ribonuclease H [candidate division CPR2 bacterium]|uniref:Ribonuclease H n=1 Tax=candidate division CPR2 bacterium GW2011_GWC1_41_48 TaxID=1618344 RepID=A0A0G0W8D9_UNCC2|nr:MAG: Ribonuclease H [candidate division CPR2 bacterium GW2011_GWC2_39_35]KKR27281.1 MAG: Ribonuclease H [candidate division CPR2 bacterium GW2011_GWD2_39_7]KKS09245.1 MAG: Ribonuclease H [candidate division CPR2 bacterium GW2011_GWC1_41_48]OGB70488.1 MAG: hypothetical protein A2Y26_03030 [candidate division CPR2 bacterium GWD2_39_7]HBG82000.1 ribonuclease H [candidate division CPR2 bacterium]